MPFTPLTTPTSPTAPATAPGTAARPRRPPFPADSLVARSGAAVLHAVLWLMLATTLYGFGIIQMLPGTPATLAATGGLAWDAGWFAQIAQQGYHYTAGGQSNVAFFPLFPLVWRWSGLGPTGIGVLNAVVFLSAFTGLAHALRLSPRYMLLALSVPSSLFMLVPYSEAWFFLFGALLLSGLHRERTAWVLVGLLGCGLTRSASALFTPALLFMVGVLLAQGHRRLALQWGVGGLLALAASLGAVLAYQTSFPGVPATGFVDSHVAWGHLLDWPKWPLYTDAGTDVVWYSAVAFAVGVASVGGCLWLTGRCAWLLTKGRPAPSVSPAVLFSMGYCVAALLFVLGYQGGKIAGLHRYIFGAPFFVALLWQTSRWPAWRLLTYGGVAAVLLGLWQAFGAWGQFPNFSLDQSAWYFGLTTAYALAWLGVRHGPFARELGTGLYVFNLVFQIYLLNMMLHGVWIE